MTTAPLTGAPRTPSGALRLVEAQTTEPRTVDIAGYVEAVTAHCPYLAPSVRRGLTTWTVYEVASEERELVEAGLFHAGVQAAEWVRPLATRPHGALVCENVVLLGGTSEGRLLDWPHWALKHLYGPVGLMIGKFHCGEERRDREGLPIAPPPYSFLPVRPAVRARDPRFLADTPDLADALAVAVDDGRDVFAQLSHDWQAVKAWSRSLPVPPRPARQQNPSVEAR
ncbi:MAG TPA: hypothetical protein VIU15_22655 [Streptomyces sp.]